jgi:hypothetical protein
MSAMWQKLAFRNEMRLAGLSLQETLTSLLNIVLLSTGNKATIAVVHHLIINANFVRSADIKE